MGLSICATRHKLSKSIKLNDLQNDFQTDKSDIAGKCKKCIEEEDVYIQIQKALKPMRIQTIICTYIVMAGSVLICIE